MIRVARPSADSYQAKDVPIPKDVSYNAAPSATASRFFGGLTFGRRNQADALAEEKRKQEEFIRQQLKALELDNGLEEQRQRQEALIQVTIAQKGEKEKEKEENERRKEERRPEKSRKEEQQRQQTEERGRQAAAEEAGQTPTDQRSTFKNRSSEGDIKKQTPPEAPVLSALERRRRLRATTGRGTHATRSYLPQGRRSGKGENREIIRVAIDTQIERVSPKRRGKRVDTAGDAKVDEPQSPRKSRVSATDVPTSSPARRKPPRSSTLSPISPDDLGSSGASPRRRERRSERSTAAISHSRAKSVALSAHLEAERTKKSRRRRNRHGDEVSLGTMQQSQGGQSLQKVEGSKQRTTSLPLTEERANEERPWESESVQQLVRMATYETTPPASKNEDDAAFLERDNAVFKRSAFGLNYDPNGSAPPDSTLNEVVEEEDKDDPLIQEVLKEEESSLRQQEDKLSESADHVSSNFEKAWDQVEADQGFVAELKRLKAKEGINNPQAPKQRNIEQVKRLKLFKGKKRKDLTSRKGNHSTTFSKEFKDAMDNVFSSDNEDEEYTSTFTTRIVEGLPRELRRRSTRNASPTLQSRGSEHDESEDKPESIIQRLRAKSLQDKSDTQSIRSRRTERSQVLDSRSRTTTRSTPTSRSTKSCSRRSHRSTPSTFSDLVLRRQRHKGASDQSTKSKQSSRYRISREESPRTSSRPHRSHPNKSSTPPRRRLKSSDQSVKSTRTNSTRSTGSRSHSRSLSSRHPSPYRSLSSGKSTSPRRRLKSSDQNVKSTRTNGARLTGSRSHSRSVSSRHLSPYRSLSSGKSGHGSVSERSSRSGSRPPPRTPSTDSTVGSRSMRSGTGRSSKRSARTWDIGNCRTDPVQFYAKEMERLKNKTFSAGGIQKEMDELRKRRAESSSSSKKKTPPRSKPRVSGGVPSYDPAFHTMQGQPLEFGFASPFSEPGTGQDAQDTLLRPSSRSRAASTFLETFDEDGKAAAFPLDSKTGSHSADLVDSIISKPSRRLPRMRRAIFQRCGAALNDNNQGQSESLFEGCLADQVE